LPYQPTSSYGIPSLPAAIYLEPEFQAARPNLVDVWAGALPEHCHWRTPALPLIVDVIDNALCRPGTAMSTSARGHPASPARPTTVDVIGQPGLQGPAIVDAPRQSGLARPVSVNVAYQSGLRPVDVVARRVDVDVSCLPGAATTGATAGQPSA